MATKKTSTKKSLADVKMSIAKTLGDGVLTSLDDEALEVERIPTGVLAVDKILGGGLPKGTFVEAAGVAGSGKSAIAQSAIAQAQELGNCVYVDLEHSLDPHMLETSGVDTSKLMIAQPESTEDTLTILDELLEVDEVPLIVVDSVAGMVPRSEISGDYGDAQMAVQARLMSQGLRKLRSKMTSVRSSAIIFWVNQLRANIQSMGYGPQTVTTGGKALSFWCSTRLEVSRIKNLGADPVIGHQVKVKVTKNRHAPPFQTGTFDIYYDSGISNGSTLIELGVAEGLIKQSGAWFADAETGEKLGQGKLNAANHVEDDAELFNKYVSVLLGIGG